MTMIRETPRQLVDSYEKQDRIDDAAARFRDMGPQCGTTFPVETNLDVEAQSDRADTAQELRDCIEAHLYCPSDTSSYDPDINAVAEKLVPLIVRVAKLKENAEDAQAELCRITNMAIDYLEVIALCGGGL